MTNAELLDEGLAAAAEHRHEMGPPYGMSGVGVAYTDSEDLISKCHLCQETILVDMSVDDGRVFGEATVYYCPGRLTQAQQGCVAAVREALDEVERGMDLPDGVLMCADSVDFLGLWYTMGDRLTPDEYVTAVFSKAAQDRSYEPGPAHAQRPPGRPRTGDGAVGGGRVPQKRSRPPGASRAHPWHGYARLALARAHVLHVSPTPRSWGSG